MLYSYIGFDFVVIGPSKNTSLKLATVGDRNI